LSRVAIIPACRKTNLAVQNVTNRLVITAMKRFADPRSSVSTLLCYVPIVVWPAIRAIRLNPRGADGAAVCLVLLWGLALTGLSTYTLPSTTFSSLLISLWAGRCHLLLAENAHWKFARARTTSIFRPKAGH
jgi:hypothetical protein